MEEKEHIERDYAKAKLLDGYPDRAKIKWPKMKKFYIPRGRTEARKRTRRPPTAKYKLILQSSGRNLERCEKCGNSYTHATIQIHHMDGNPWNNNLDNLAVLCNICHEKIHGVDEAGVIDEKTLVRRAE